MKYFKKNIKLLLFLAILAILLFTLLIYNSNPKIYSSKAMKISFEAPVGSTIEDKFASITITNKDGEILISRNGTNFSDLDSYLNSLHQKNQVKILSSKNLNIDNHPAFKQTLEDEIGMPNNRIVYFIYVDNRIYSLSTSSPELYDELDQIAQSFKYTGN